MNRKEETILGLSYWIASLDGNLDVKEKEFIEKSSFLKPFYSTENFDHCKKEITTKSKNKDTKKFVSEYLNGFEITKEESKKLVNDLCEVGSADGDFDDIEKKYIGFIVEELGLSKEKIVENFEKTKEIAETKVKPTTTTLGADSLAVPKDLLFLKKEKELTPIVQQKIQRHIEKKLSIKDFDLRISNLKINKTQKLSTQILYDNRTVEEDVEINYRGIIASRSVFKSAVGLFSSKCNNGKLPERTDYDFKNLNKTTKFRVDGSNDKVTCSTCGGDRTVPCSTCGAKGKLPCSRCGTRGTVDCSRCDGKGYTKCRSWSCNNGWTTRYDSTLGRDVRKPCSSCGGTPTKQCCTGQVRCPSSGCQSGWKTCYRCSGKTYVPCSRCAAKGSFIYFLRIVSVLMKKESNAFIQGEPDKFYVSKRIATEEFEHSSLFGKYQLTSLKNHSSELKNLFKTIKLGSSQKPQRVRFCLDDCASMSFVINIAGNVYLGGLGNDGKLFFDETILDQLFFNIIKSLNIDQSFRAIESIKTPVLAQIPNFNETFEKINQYKSLSKIVSSTDKKEKKLNDTRKLTKINTINFSKFLVSEIRKKNNIASLVVALACYLPIWFFYPILTTIVSVLFLLNYVFTSVTVINHLKDTKKDAFKVKGAWIRRFITIYVFSLLVTVPLGENRPIYNEYLAGFNMPVFDPFGVERYGMDEAFLTPEERLLKKEREVYFADSLGADEAINFITKWKQAVNSNPKAFAVDNFKKELLRYAGRLNLGGLPFSETQLSNENNRFSIKLYNHFKKDFNIVDSDSIDSRLSYFSDSVILLRPTGKKKSYYYIKEGSDYTMEISPYRVYDSKRKVYVNLSDEGYEEVKNRPYTRWRFSRSGLGDEIVTSGYNIERDEASTFGVLYVEDSYEEFYNMLSGKNEHAMFFGVRYVSFNKLKRLFGNNIKKHLDFDEEERVQQELDRKAAKEKEDEKAQKLAEEKRKLEEERKKQIAADKKKEFEETRKRLREEAKLAKYTNSKNSPEKTKKKPTTDGFEEWYSSERKSNNFSKPLRDVVRQIKKDYNIKVEKVIMFRPPNVVKQENAVTGYYFDTQSEMERFKKAVSNIQTVKLYIENKQDKILYYSSPNNNKL